MPDTRPLLLPENLDMAKRAAGARALCVRCLGRVFARVETGMGNDARGRIVADATGADTVAGRDCSVCRGVFDDVHALAGLVAQAAEAQEFATFLIGSRLDPAAVAAEKELLAALGREPQEAMGSELNREIGKRVQAALAKKVDVKRPDVTFIVDAVLFHVEAQVAPLFLAGRYEKLERGIPQTHWPCRRCRGLGCVTCGGKGRLYETSVEELVAAEALRASGASEAFLHGAGREDIDALMLGAGRPFVLELRRPRTRSLDVAALEAAMDRQAAGRVKVHGLAWTDSGAVARVKETRSTKEYRAIVDFEGPVTAETLIKVVGSLRSRVVAQRTPSRVAHRRADLVRERLVLDVSVESHAASEAVLRITGEAGLYVKELVSGDGGRTVPSLAGLLGVPARVRELDVTGVGGSASGGEDAGDEEEVT